MTYVPIIDVSRYQGNVNWSAVRTSEVHNLGPVQGAYLKATESSSYVDPTLDRNWNTAKHLNFPVGAYHFARPSGVPAEDARTEAQHFVRTIKGLYAGNKNVLPPMLDLETTTLPPAETSDWMDYFLGTVEDLMSAVPIIYTGSFTPFENRKHFLRYDLWIARYPAGYTAHPDPEKLKPAPTRPYWPQWSVWQYTSSGNVDGIAGNVDINVARSEWFDRVTKRATTPKDPTKAEMAQGIYIRASANRYAFTDGASTTVLQPTSAVEEHRELFDPEKKLPNSVLVSDALWDALVHGQG